MAQRLETSLFWHVMSSRWEDHVCHCDLGVTRFVRFRQLAGGVDLAGAAFCLLYMADMGSFKATPLMRHYAEMHLGSSLLKLPDTGIR